MNQRRLFQRKIIFLALICALLFPLFALSQPATTKSAGGQLAQLRTRYKLSEADLGQIDPTSVSMKLATFGLQGAATNILWTRAIQYKEREDWTNFDATLNQITKLQPHFVKVWDFQGHNVAFNISVEFDDYRDKYRHIIKGFNLLKDGIRYNEKSARLIRRLANYIGIKIGRSDEKKFYRPMFAADRDYHAPPRNQNPLTGTRYEDRPENLTDNWLVSKWWYQQAQDLIDSGITPIGTMNPFIIHADAAMQQMQYANALEADGNFGTEMQNAWKQAAREWLAYGLRPILTTLGFEVKLEDVDLIKQKRDEAYNAIMDLEPGLLDKLRKERIEKLSDEEKQIIDIKPEDRNEEQAKLAAEVARKTTVSLEDIARSTSEENRALALNLAQQYFQYAAQYRVASQYKDITMNYGYWRDRAETEQKAELMRVRKLLYDADQAFKESDIPTAQRDYEQAFNLWREILDEKPELLEEETFIEDLKEEIEQYQKLLAQVRDDGSRALPNDFPLLDVLENTVAPAN
ncbi:MAG: hypothetical protein P8K78_01225 [Pirellulales bacterium]|nr:hypothetical protein [Pirellulales bacterium]